MHPLQRSYLNITTFLKSQLVIRPVLNSTYERESPQEAYPAWENNSNHEQETLRHLVSLMYVDQTKRRDLETHAKWLIINIKGALSDLFISYLSSIY